MTRWSMTCQEAVCRCLNASTGNALVLLHNVPVRTAELMSRSLDKAGAEAQHDLVLVHQLVEVLLRWLRHLWHNRI